MTEIWNDSPVTNNPGSQMARVRGIQGAGRPASTTNSEKASSFILNTAMPQALDAMSSYLMDRGTTPR